MPYIDHDFYEFCYIGESFAYEDFDRYEQRAEEVVDQLTGYVIRQRGLDTFSEFIRGQIRLAVAAQVEFYVLEGITVATDGVVQDNFTVGKVSVSSGSGRASSSRAGSLGGRSACPKTVALLAPTGLLYRGVDVRC